MYVFLNFHSISYPFLFPSSFFLLLANPSRRTNISPPTTSFCFYICRQDRKKGRGQKPTNPTHTSIPPPTLSPPFSHFFYLKRSVHSYMSQNPTPAIANQMRNIRQCDTYFEQKNLKSHKNIQKILIKYISFLYIFLSNPCKSLTARACLSLRD